jgi:ABC-type Na+ efflux pump permease subunit
VRISALKKQIILVENRMKRILTIVVLLALLGVGGYYLIGAGTDTAVEGVTEVTEEVTEGEIEVGNAVTEAVEEAVGTVAETASEAVDATTDAVSGAVDAVTEAATDAVDAVAPTETETVVVDGATETVVEASDLASLLTVDGFDPDAVLEAIDGSDLSTLTKTGLRTTVEGARDNPEMVPGVIEQVRGALGL